MCACVARSARALQNPGTDVASYCALPAESRSTSLSDWVTECRASFIGVHFRPEKPILLGDTRRTIHLHTLSYHPSLSETFREMYAVTCRHFVTCWRFNNKRMRRHIFYSYTSINSNGVLQFPHCHINRDKNFKKYIFSLMSFRTLILFKRVLFLVGAYIIFNCNIRQYTAKSRLFVTIIFVR